jgi:hypothetical protein
MFESRDRRGSAPHTIQRQKKIISDPNCGSWVKIKTFNMSS